MPFLVFEGLDGSGKSTLIQGLDQHLRSQNQRVLVTREPGGTPLGEEIRHMLLRVLDPTPVAKAELLLYQAARAQHVHQVIWPSLKRGDWVLCDRFIASSLAFQCGGRGIKVSEVEWLNAFATDSLKADLTILLDLTVEQSRKRQEGRQKEKNQDLDRFEREKEDFHSRVRQEYLRLSTLDPQSWLVLDAENKPEDLLSLSLKAIEGRKWQPF